MALEDPFAALVEGADAAASGDPFAALVEEPKKKKLSPFQRQAKLRLAQAKQQEAEAYAESDLIHQIDPSEAHPLKSLGSAGVGALQSPVRLLAGVVEPFRQGVHAVNEQFPQLLGTPQLEQFLGSAKARLEQDQPIAEGLYPSADRPTGTGAQIADAIAAAPADIAALIPAIMAGEATIGPKVASWLSTLSPALQKLITAGATFGGIGAAEKSAAGGTPLEVVGEGGKQALLGAVMEGGKGFGRVPRAAGVGTMAAAMAPEGERIKSGVTMGALAGLSPAEETKAPGEITPEQKVKNRGNEAAMEAETARKEQARVDKEAERIIFADQKEKANVAAQAEKQQVRLDKEAQQEAEGHAKDVEGLRRNLITHRAMARLDQLNEMIPEGAPITNLDDILVYEAKKQAFEDLQKLGVPPIDQADYVSQVELLAKHRASVANPPKPQFEPPPKPEPPPPPVVDFVRATEMVLASHKFNHLNVNPSERMLIERIALSKGGDSSRNYSPETQRRLAEIASNMNVKPNETPFSQLPFQQAPGGAAPMFLDDLLRRRQAGPELPGMSDPAADAGRIPNIFEPRPEIPMTPGIDPFAEAAARQRLPIQPPGTMPLDAPNPLDMGQGWERTWLNNPVAEAARLAEQGTEWTPEAQRRQDELRASQAAPEVQQQAGGGNQGQGQGGPANAGGPPSPPQVSAAKAAGVAAGEPGGLAREITSESTAEAFTAPPVKRSNRRLDEWLNKPTYRTVSRMAGTVGERLGQMAQRASDRTRAYRGELEATMNSVLRQVNRSNNATEWMTGKNVTRTGNGSVSNGRAAIEGDIPSEKIPSYAKPVIAGYNKLISDSGAIAERLGQTIVDPVTGIESPFRKSEGGRKALRVHTEEFYRILKNGPDDPLFKTMQAEIMDMNGLSETRAFEGMAEIYKSMGGDAGWAGKPSTVRRGASEIMRVFEKMPDHLRNPATGKWIPILETDPFEMTKQAVERQVTRFGTNDAFGQDPAKGSVIPAGASMDQAIETYLDARAKGQVTPGLRPSNEQLMAYFDAHGGDPAVGSEFFRQLNGIRLEAPYFDPVQYPIMYRVAQGYNVTVKQILDSLNISLAGPLNAIEVVSKTRPAGGNVRFLTEPVAEYVRQSKKVGVAKAYSQMRQDLARAGALTVDVMNHRINPERRLESFGRVFRDVTGTVTGLKFAVEFAETWAALSGNAMSRDLRSGNSGYLDSARLAWLGYDKPTTVAILKGEARLLAEGTPPETVNHLYDSIATRLAERTQGINQTLIEKPRSAEARWYRSNFSFDSYFRMTADRFGKTIDVIRKAEGPQEKAKAAALAGDLLLGHAAAGVGGVLIAAYLKGGKPSYHAVMDDAKEDPPGFVWDSFLSATFGSAGQKLAQGIQAKRGERFYQPLVESIRPVFGALQFVEFMSGQGRYKQRNWPEKARQALQSNIPITKALTTMLAVTSLGERDLKREAAENRYWKWRENNAPTGGGWGKKSDFGKAMGRAYRLIKEHASDDKIAEAVNAALRVNGNNAKTVRQSILAQRLLPDIPKNLQKKFEKDVAADIREDLKIRHDDVLQAWAGKIYALPEGEVETTPGGQEGIIERENQQERRGRFWY